MRSHLQDIQVVFGGGGEEVELVPQSPAYVAVEGGPDAADGG